MIRDNLRLLRVSLLLFGLCFPMNAQQAETGAKVNDAAQKGPLFSSSSVRLMSFAQDEQPPSIQAPPALIIKNFIDAERKFRETIIQFAFKRDVVLQTIGPAGEVTGEYIRNSVFVLDDSGQRVEQVVYHPKPTISEMKITKEDIQDLAGSQLFGLETEKLNAADFSYHLSYVGEETIDGRAAYRLAVRPKQEPNPHQMSTRFFVGHIWIDPVTFQTIKLRGITEPQGKQRFPIFETERELKIEDQIFPSQTTADDILHFSHKDVHYRIKVRYYDFKRFASRLKIVEVNE
jgi:hypothetical protein